jgi:uncharacterized protein (DUF58 family)
VVLPFSTLAAIVPAAATFSLFLILGFLILASGDGLLGYGRIRETRVEPPDIVRVARGRQGEIALRIRNDKGKIRNLRIGVALPPGIDSPYYHMTAQVPEDRPDSLLAWPIRGLKHGRFFLDRWVLEIPSRLGFWAVRKTIPAPVEIRVYPDLLSEPKELSALFLNKALGIHGQRQIGKGRDFEQLREYLPGDCYEDIHWKATAKRGHPITKVFQVERTQEVYVIIDTSRLSARHAPTSSDRRLTETEQSAPYPTRILDRFVTASLIIGLAAERQGDLFGVLVFSDRVQGFVRAKKGKAHYRVCRDALYTIEAQPVTPDFSELFTFIATRLRRRALLLFLTNLEDPVLADEFVQRVGLLSKRHLATVNMIQPPDGRPLFSAPDVASVDDLYRRLGGHLLWNRIRETQRVLKRQGVGTYLLDNDRMCVQLVSQYLDLKKRQIL